MAVPTRAATAVKRARTFILARTRLRGSESLLGSSSKLARLVRSVYALQPFITQEQGRIQAEESPQKTPHHMVCRPWGPTILLVPSNQPPLNHMISLSRLPMGKSNNYCGARTDTRGAAKPKPHMGLDRPPHSPIPRRIATDHLTYWSLFSIDCLNPGLGSPVAWRFKQHSMLKPSPTWRAREKRSVN